MEWLKWLRVLLFDIRSLKRPSCESIANVGEKLVRVYARVLAVLGELGGHGEGWLPGCPSV